MANDEESVWMYEPNFPLAVVGCIAYGLLLIAITYFTWFRFRAWYFSVVVIGTLVEVAGYVCRAYSVKHQTVIVSYCTFNYNILLSKSRILTSEIGAIRTYPHPYRNRPRLCCSRQLPPHQPSHPQRFASLTPPNPRNPRPTSHTNLRHV